MKVFVSWSGERSQVLAHALREWLPLVLHYVEPWLSESDVAAGDRWASAIAAELEASNFGIICVTSENAESPWLLFEAGALAKSMQGARVIPLLFDLEFSDITGPLAQFQAKKVEKVGLGEVVHSINQGADHSVPEERAKQLFEALWPRFEELASAIPPAPPASKHMRPQHEIIEELVTGVRALDGRFRDLETAVSETDMGMRRRRGLRVHPMMLEEISRLLPDGPDDPTALLIMAGLLREDLPWITEVLVETYRDVRAGDEKTVRAALERLSRVTRLMVRGHIMDELFLDAREGYALMREFPHFIERWVHTYGAVREVTGPAKTRDMSDESTGTA